MIPIDELVLSAKRRLWMFKMGYKSFGKKSVIDKPYMVRGKKYITVGKNVTIRRGARIEMVDKWREDTFEPELIIEDNVTIEQHLHIGGAGKIVIGQGTMITLNVLLGGIKHFGVDLNESILSQEISSEDIIIGKNCFIGKNACILGSVTLGDGVIVGANSVVTKDVPPYAVVAGVPAKIIGKRNER